MVSNGQQFEIILLSTICFLSLLKTVLFFGITDNKTFLNWFYFKFEHRYNSSLKRMRRAKEYQNRYSAAIFSLLLFAGLIHLYVVRIF